MTVNVYAADKLNILHIDLDLEVSCTISKSLTVYISFIYIYTAG